MSAPNCQELIAAISNIFVATSAIVVAIVAIVGVSQWRKEMIGKTKFDVAKKLAMLLYQYRNEFEAARSPFTFPGESADRVKGEHETKDESSTIDEYYARKKRLLPLQKRLIEVMETSWEAEIVLDKEIKHLIEPLKQSFIDLRAAIEIYFFKVLEDQRNRHAPSAQVYEELQKQWHIVYGTDKDDTFKSVNASVENIVVLLRNYIK